MLAVKTAYVVVLTSLVGLVCADLAPQASALKVVGHNSTMEGKVTPMELLSQGCQSCCQGGQCDRAFGNQIPGTCCSSQPMSCCPTSYNGQRYYCGGGTQCSTQSNSGPAPPPPPPPAVPFFPSGGRGPSPAPFFPEPAAAATVCNRDTGGSCRFFSCSSDRGPTTCEGGIFSGKKCVCAPGHCAYNGKCIKPTACETWTPGTCGYFGCKSSRGDVDCKDGKCKCKEGACSVDGVCVQTCEKDTGGSCSWFGCKSSRNAECKSGKCVCKRHDCNYQGTCEDGKDVEEMFALAMNGTAMIKRAQKSSTEFNSFSAVLATYLDTLPDADDPVFVYIVFSVTMALLVTASTCIAMRRRTWTPLSKPLLDGSA